MKSFPTSDAKKKSSLRELLLPEDAEAEREDSDYELLCRDGDDSSAPETAPPTPTAATGNYFATAESVTVDDLLEDVDYVDESNMKELKQLFERIKGRVKKEN